MIIERSAEDGCYVKPKPNIGEKTEWINMVPNVNMAWKKPAKEILEYVSCINVTGS